MEFTTLGRTGLRVSRMGLGCGGHSRLGQATGRSEQESIQVVREALDLGVNFIDTAEAYGTEEIVGKALQDRPRDAFVLSSKVHVEKDGRRSSPEEFRRRIEAGLRRLQMDTLDILHLHGLSVDHYAYAREHLVPVFQQLQVEGKIRFVGITEAFAPDPGHKMFELAQRDDCWDVIMVGFNILNQSARERVLPWTERKDVGTLCMFAVRKALSDPKRLRELIGEMLEAGLVDAKEIDAENPLGFLIERGEAVSVTEAAYRFCRWEPGIDVVLSGTGNLDHLRENVRFLNGPPLSSETIALLKSFFAEVDSVSGN